MVNRHDDTPVINDYTFYVFEEIEKRGLQFAIPEAWRPVYRAFLAERKRKRELVQTFNAIPVRSQAFILSRWSESGSYQNDFGNKGTATTEENSKANTAAGPLEE